MASDKVELSRLCAEVRKTYFLEHRAFLIRYTGEDFGQLELHKHYKQWDGGVDYRGVKHAPVWPKIVAYASMHGLDPCLLVQAVFAMHEHAEPPLPNMIVGPYALECYQTFERGSGERLRLKLELQEDSFEKEVWRQSEFQKRTNEDCQSRALTSPTVDCDALFRFYKALSLGFESIALSCRHAATMQYLMRPDDYDEVYGNKLPQEFKESARLTRQAMTS